LRRLGILQFLISPAPSQIFQQERFESLRLTEGAYSSSFIRAPLESEHGGAFARRTKADMIRDRFGQRPMVPFGSFKKTRIQDTSGGRRREAGRNGSDESAAAGGRKRLELLAAPLLAQGPDCYAGEGALFSPRIRPGWPKEDRFFRCSSPGLAARLFRFLLGVPDAVILGFFFRRGPQPTRGPREHVSRSYVRSPLLLDGPIPGLANARQKCTYSVPKEIVRFVALCSLKHRGPGKRPKEKRNPRDAARRAGRCIPVGPKGAGRTNYPPLPQSEPLGGFQGAWHGATQLDPYLFSVATAAFNSALPSRPIF